MAERTARRILTINSGSSSIKFSLFEMGEGEKSVVEGAVSRIGLRSSLFKVARRGGESVAEEHRDLPDHEAAFTLIFKWLRAFSDGPPLDAVGHKLRGITGFEQATDHQ